MIDFYEFLVCNNEFLVPVEDALGGTIPPAPVLRSLFNLIPADARFPEIFLYDIFPVLLRSTWPPPETLGFPCESLSRKSIVIHSWKMSKPSQTSASDNVFQLWKCSCLSDFLICYFVLPGNPHDTSLPSVVCCFEFFSFGWLRLATALHCWATWRELVLRKALFSLVITSRHSYLRQLWVLFLSALLSCSAVLSIWLCRAFLGK